MELKTMELNELEALLKSLSTEKLLNVFDYFAKEDCMSFRYCEVRAEIYRRLEEKKNDD